MVAQKIHVTCCAAIIPVRDAFHLHFEMEKVFNNNLEAWSAVVNASPWTCPTLLNIAPIHTDFFRTRVDLFLPQNYKLPEETNNL